MEQWGAHVAGPSPRASAAGRLSGDDANNDCRRPEDDGAALRLVPAAAPPAWSASPKRSAGHSLTEPSWPGLNMTDAAPVESGRPFGHVVSISIRTQMVWCGHRLSTCAGAERLSPVMPMIHCDGRYLLGCFRFHRGGCASRPWVTIATDGQRPTVFSTLAAHHAHHRPAAGLSPARHRKRLGRCGFPQAGIGPGSPRWIAPGWDHRCMNTQYARGGAQPAFPLVDALAGAVGLGGSLEVRASMWIRGAASGPLSMSDCGTAAWPSAGVSAPTSIRR